MRLNYLFRVLSGVRFDKLNQCIADVHKKSGKNKFAILLDMVGCAVKYGAGYYDYCLFEYYNMNSKQRKTYLTRFKNKKLMRTLNDCNFTEIFDKKTLFYQNFADFIGRDFLLLDSNTTVKQVQDFVNGKEYIIAKPSEGECGKGIQKLKIADFDNADSLYNYLMDRSNNFDVIEDLVIQHPKMSELYPHSVNCFRMVTLVNNGVAHTLYAVLKTGNNGKFTDNLESGGFCCHVDMSDGTVIGPGHDNRGNLSEIHPATNVAFRGFKPPFFNEAVELVQRAALVIPQVRYIGWDVCITENGPLIIEGNNYPAYDFPQLPDDSQNRVGLLKKIQDIGIKI